MIDYSDTRRRMIVFFGLLLIIFVVETAVMYSLPVLFPRLTGPAAAVLDALFLIALISLPVYLLVIRPLQKTASEEKVRADQTLHEKREVLAALFSASPLAIIAIDRNARVISWNPSAERIFGWRAEEAIGKYNPIVPDEQINQFRDLVRRAIGGERLENLELRRKRKDGSLIDVNLSTATLHDAHGGAIGIMAVIADITDRKIAEQRLKWLNRTLAMLSAVNKAIVHIHDRAGLFQEACRIAVEDGGFRMAWIGVVDPLTQQVKRAASHGADEGYTDGIRISTGDDASGQGPTGRAIRENRHTICNDMEKDPAMLPWREDALKRGFRSSAAFPIRLGNYPIGAINLYSSEAQFFDDDELRLLDEMSSDISLALKYMEEERQRKEAEELVALAKLDWEETFNTITDMVTIHDRDFNIIRANKAAEKILGLPELNVTGAKCHKHYHGTKCPPEGCPSCRSLVTGRPAKFELFEPHLNMYLELQAIPRLDVDGGVVGLIHVGRDITEQKQVEERLAKSEMRLRTIIENEPECVKLLAEDGSLLDMNPAGLRMIEADSLEQVKGRSVLECVLPEYRQAFQSLTERVFRGESGSLEFEIVGLKGTRRWAQTVSVPLRDPQGAVSALLGVTRDITEQKKLESQLRHAQKMEAVGTLTGGIAHDFNNILTAIVGYGNILKLKMKPDDPLRTHVDQILSSTDRAASLTQGLLTFSRKLAISPRPVNLNEIISRVEKLLLRLIGEDIELKTVLADEDTTIVAESGQIEQVLMNLCTNARDVMPSGGQLTIATEQSELNTEFISAHGYGRPGRYVLVTVTDTGSGMDERTREKIFEPFFTTKEVGKGTGLGLSIAYGIIKQHNGYITVQSEPGRGASFSVYFPLAEARAQSPESKKTGMPRGGTETVLLAEDDAMVRNLTKTVLREFGYHVIEAEDGEAAVKKFRENPGGINLLLLDVMMPKKDGREAYEDMRKVRPDIRYLFMSGYAETIVRQKGVLEDKNFVLKPVSPGDLLKKVREALDG